MSNVIMIGCDLHEDTLMLKIAPGTDTPETRLWKNTARDRQRMVADLQRRAKRAGITRVVFVYEASCAGYGLYDQLTDAGFEAYVLAPTKIPSTTRQKKEKTDEKDALLLLNLVRAFVLAGNPLPAVWIPDAQTRDDRELVRTRLDASNKIGLLKNQVKSLLKRNQARRPTGLGKSWTRSYRAWLLATLIQPVDLAESPLNTGTRQALASLVRQLDFLEKEQERLDLAVSALVDTPRYLEPLRELTRLSGVGTLTALVFLTEMGDLGRFANRREVAAYLGLAPSCFESGRSNDRKGRITRQGSPRVRRVLCQAAWTSVRRDPLEKATYTRIKEKNPKKRRSPWWPRCAAWPSACGMRANADGINRRRSPASFPQRCGLRPTSGLDFRRSEQGVQREWRKASGRGKPLPEAASAFGAPWTRLSLVRLRPRRAGLRFAAPHAL